MEQQEPQNDVKTADAAEAQAAALSDGGASFAARLASNRPWEILRGLMWKMYGIVLLLGAVGGASGLAVAYLPILPDQGAQLAAAETSVNVPPPGPFDFLELQARAAYVYDVQTGEELFAKNATTALPIASITKVALMLAVSEVLQPGDLVTISQSALATGPGGLAWGEVWQMRDLVDYTLITSSNSGANALAEEADARLHAKYPEAPAGRAAIWRMNMIADELGLDSMTFLNATGLDENETGAGALGSARDIARLFEHALNENPALFAGTRRSGIALAPLNFPSRIAKNTNNALAEIPGILMGKTGTTDLAGGNLAIAFDVAPEEAEETHPIIIVVLGSTEDGRYDDMRKLVEAARAKFPVPEKEPEPAATTTPAE